MRRSRTRLCFDAHPGFLRASLLLDVDLGTTVLLSGVDVQEFLAAAYATETIDSHVCHTRHDRLLAFARAAPGLREVIDARFELFTRPTPEDLPAALSAIDGTLNPAARVSSRVTGRAEPYYDVVVET